MRSGASVQASCRTLPPNPIPTTRPTVARRLTHPTTPSVLPQILRAFVARAHCQHQWDEGRIVKAGLRKMYTCLKCRKVEFL